MKKLIIAGILAILPMAANATVHERNWGTDRNYVSTHSGENGYIAYNYSLSTTGYRLQVEQLGLKNYYTRDLQGNRVTYENKYGRRGATPTTLALVGNRLVDDAYAEGGEGEQWSRFYGTRGIDKPSRTNIGNNLVVTSEFAQAHSDGWDGTGFSIAAPNSNVVAKLAPGAQRATLNPTYYGVFSSTGNSRRATMSSLRGLSAGFDNTADNESAALAGAAIVMHKYRNMSGRDAANVLHRTARNHNGTNYISMNSALSPAGALR